MSLISAFFIALALSMDCFAVAVSTGLCHRGIPAKEILKMGISFGAFQAGMTVLGYFFGSILQKQISGIDHWIAFGLLAFLGIHMIVAAVRDNGEESCPRLDLRTLLTLSVATSIDALAVGVTFAMVSSPIAGPAAIIGLVSLIVPVIGANIGKRAATHFSSKGAEIAGGIVLTGIGVKILIEHLS